MFEQTNKDIRKLIFDSKIPMWKIAETYGITDSTFSKKLRKELSKEEKEKIKSIIKEIKNIII